MKCPNCDFESEDNFCRVCGMEIPETDENESLADESISEQLPEENTNEAEQAKQPDKFKLKPKHILISSIAAVLAVALVSAASIGIYAYITKPDEKLYFHTLGQKVDCGSFSIALTDIQQPYGEFVKNTTTYYMAKNNDETYYEDKSSYIYNGLTDDDVVSVSETYYYLNVYYPVTFTIENHSFKDLEFSVPDISIFSDYYESGYSTTYYADENYLIEYSEDDVETNDKGYIDVTSFSSKEVTKTLEDLVYYDSENSIPKEILAQIENQTPTVTEGNYYTKECYKINDVSCIDYPEDIYTQLSIFDVKESFQKYDWLKFCIQYSQITDTTSSNDQLK
jgi:hypothetical protein